MHPITQNRPIVAMIIAIFFTLFSGTNFVFGYFLWNGEHIALTCVTAGFALGAWLWTQFSWHRPVKGADYVFLSTFVAASGVSLYTNLCWVFWALQLPISLGSVKNNTIASLYYLGPVTIIVAFFFYAALHYHLVKSIRLE